MSTVLRLGKGFNMYDGHKVYKDGWHGYVFAAETDDPKYPTGTLIFFPNIPKGFICN